jgi:hypothetical protein
MSSNAFGLTTEDAATVIESNSYGYGIRSPFQAATLVTAKRAWAKDTTGEHRVSLHDASASLAPVGVFNQDVTPDVPGRRSHAGGYNRMAWMYGDSSAGIISLGRPATSAPAGPVNQSRLEDLHANIGNAAGSTTNVKSHYVPINPRAAEAVHWAEAHPVTSGMEMELGKFRSKEQDAFVATYRALNTAVRNSTTR